jgi:hypothetical protein
MAFRILVFGAASAAFVAVAGFIWFVLISWNVLRQSLGFGPLVLLLLVAAGVAVTWALLLLRSLRRPARPTTPVRPIGVVAVTLVAAMTGLVAVPATRARLETRREWWTLGLSHRNPGQR